MPPRPGPILFDDPTPAAQPGPAEAAPVPEADAGLPEGRAMQTAAVLAARRPSRLWRFFWSVAGALLGFLISLAAWDFVTGLLARNQLLGSIALALVALMLAALLLIASREALAFARLARIDTLQRDAAAALATADLKAARGVAEGLAALYSARPDLALARERLAARTGDVFDADGLLGLAEAELLTPHVAAARAAVEAAARQVALVTAVVPLALADVAAALGANLRMIRRVAQIYGGRSGTLGTWRLTRSVFAHLLATGAIAAGDDLLHSVAGGGLLAKLSRRFGEGVVNGALTARVGLAAIEVCRPLPFRRLRRPSVSGLVQRALTGLFGRP